MTASIENIVQHLFHQPSLQTVSVDELQQMTQEYPSFAAARFLLLKKMQDTQHPDFSTQLHKTAIYFNNPLWLQLLLLPQKDSVAWQPSGNYVQPPELPQSIAGDPVTDEKPVQAAAESPVMQEVLDRLRDQIYDADIQTGEATPHEQEVLQSLTESEYIPGPGSDSPLMHEVLDRLRGQIQEAGYVEHIESVQQAQEAPQPPVEAPVPAELQEDIHPPVTSEQATDGMHEAMHAQLAAPVVHPPAEIAAQDDQPKEDDFAPPFADPEPVAPTLEAYAAPAETAPVEDAPLVKTIIETPSAKEDLLFEPYHTIDYFASLGIRLDKMEPNPQDKLGKQLRSFTEWLKSMKKLPQASIEKVLGENEESAVVAAASHSVVGKDIITEAMAEVFEKQGMHDKAADVYRKLSLLNPAKSAYFADRINALKR